MEALHLAVPLFYGAAPPLPPVIMQKGSDGAVLIPNCLQDIRPKAGGPPTGPKLLKRDQLPTVMYEGKLPTTQIDPK